MSHAPGELRRRLLRSGRWTLMRTVCLAILQFATIAALFRLFSIEDFAAISLVTVVLTMTQVFSQTGIDLAVVREEGDIAPLLDPCWSVAVVRGVLLAGVVAALAWPLAWWQEEPALRGYLLASALVPILDGLRSVSTVLFLRDIEQRRPAIIDTATAAIGLATLVALAAWLRSPWAFVINQIWAVALRSAVYHFAHPVRTRFTLAWGPLRRYVRFGIGYNLAAISTYLIDSIDRLLIGRSLGMHALGVYDRASTMAHYGVRQLPSLVTGSLLFPAFSRVRSDLPRFWRLARRILGSLALAGIAGAAAMWLVADPLLAFVAGDGHEIYLAPFRLLLAVALCRGIATLGQVPFYALGRPQLQTLANLAQVAVLAIGLPIAFARGGALDAACRIALAAGAANLAVTLALLVALARAGAAATTPPAPLPPEPEPERVI